MNYHWNWLFFLDHSANGQTYGYMIFTGLLLTVALSIFSFSLALLLGTLVGVCGTLNNRFLSLLSSCYINVFRNIPLIVQLFIWFFVVPDLFSIDISDRLKQEISPLVFGIFGLGFFTSSRIAVQVKAGILALPKGLTYAGRSLGMRPLQVYRYLLIPAMTRIILPSLTSEAMSNIKNSSITYVIGVSELYFQYKQIIEKTSQVIEITCFITMLYFFLNFTTFLFLQSFEKRMAIPGLLQPEEKE